MDCRRAYTKTVGIYKNIQVGNLNSRFRVSIITFVKMSQVLPMLANWIVTVDNSYDSTALSSIETIVDALGELARYKPKLTISMID